MTGVGLGVAALLVVVAALLRAGGASLVRTPRADALHDAADGDHRAEIVAELLIDRPRIQPAISLIHLTLLIAAAVPATWALTRLLEGWQLAVVLLSAAVLLVVVGDVVPRTYGRSRPKRLAFRLATLLHWAVRVGDRATDLMAVEEEPVDDELEPEDEIRERMLISSVLEFSDAIVREVMVPRPDMVTVRESQTSDDGLDVIVESGYSRLPVLDEAEAVVGFFYAKDVLRLVDDGRHAVPIIEFMRPPYFVPEAKKVPDLLQEMQIRKVHIAAVIDEFGGVAGLVTIEDLIEELVGEIVDEHDDEEPQIVPVADGSLLVDGRMPVDELGELLGVELPDDDWDTVGGLVLDLAGRVPRQGETFELSGLVLIPQRIQGRRIAQVRVVRRAAEAG